MRAFALLSSLFSTSRRRAQAGFTLLEVMISIGILAVALLAVGDLNGGAVRMHAYGKRLTVAVQLARGKMLDLQQQMRKDGLSDFSKEYHGDFDEEGWPEYKWRAQVIKPEMDVDPTTVMEQLSSGLGLGGGDKSKGGSGMTEPTQNPLAAGPMAGMIDTQVKAMVETVKSSVREVKLTVSWKSGAQEESFDVVEHIVQLPNAQQAATAAATPGTLPGTGQTGPGGMPMGVPGAAGMPGVPGMPSPLGGGMMRNPMLNPGGGIK